MSADYEIIEIGDDGAFDISSTQSVKQQVIPDIDYSTYDWNKINQESNGKLLESLNPGEYTIYRTGEKKFWLIVKLPKEDLVEGVFYSKNIFRVKVSSGKVFDITLLNECNVDEKTIQSKHFNEYITIQFQES